MVLGCTGGLFSESAGWTLITPQGSALWDEKGLNFIFNCFFEKLKNIMAPTGKIRKIL